MAYTITPRGDFMDINLAGVKLLGLASKEEAFTCNVKEFYVDISEREPIMKDLAEKGFCDGRHVKFRNRAGDIFEVAVTARAKVDDSGKLLYHDGILHNITQAMEDQRNRVLRNAAGGLCHYLNTHLMQLDGSRGLMVEELKVLEDLVDKISRRVEDAGLVAELKEAMETVHYCQEGIKEAYEKIAEVTKAFNKAFLYREESYTCGTILNIFESYGSGGEDDKNA
jgi:hypothetical protein